MNRTSSDLKYILFISDGFDRIFSSLWSYVVILCFLSKTSTPLPSSKLSGRGGKGETGEVFFYSSPALLQRACVQATYSFALFTISGKFSVWSFFIVE